MKKIIYILSLNQIQRNNIRGVVACAVLCIYFMLSGILPFAQNFLPLNSAMSKMFVNLTDSTDDAYFFHAIDTEVFGDTTIFKQYSQLSGEMAEPEEGSECQPWGGSWELLDPLWTGRKVTYIAQTQELILTNLVDDTLRFSFDLVAQDSSIFYLDDVASWYIIYDGMTEQAFLDTIDMVKIFRIRKYDLMNNLLPSGLSEFEILLSENFGLLSFINCYQFPTLEVALQIAGQTDPPLGHYQMTMDEVYPWQEGDTLEYYGYTPGPAQGVFTQTYRIMTITNRIETVDSIKIYWNFQQQVIQSPPNYTGGAAYIAYNNPIAFRKGTPITNWPNGSKRNDSNVLFDEVAYCGTRQRYRMDGTWTTYCDSCDCYLAYDGFGNIIYHSTIISGLGVTNTGSESYGWQLPSGPGVSLIYSNIDGAVCGELIPLNISEYYLENKFNIYPNPVIDVLQIRNNVNSPISAVKITDSTGRIILTEYNKQEIDVSHLSNGIYFIEVESDNGIEALRFIKV